jgi:hypothetical protein
MAWSGWWHNQVGLLTEVASARIASPIEQRKAQPGRAAAPAPEEDFQAQQRRQMENPNEPLPPPRDVTPRTEYPRPWLGGKWTLRDIVDYELIATIALLETAADHREQLLRQIYEVNRATVEAAAKGDPAAIIIAADKQHDAREAYHLVERLQMAGVEVSRAEADFEADGKKYAAGTFVIQMNQVFARYAKDLLEKQTYPEVRRSPNSPPEPPYDVTAWSLGMQMGVETQFFKKPLPQSLKLSKLDAAPRAAGEVRGEGGKFSFDYTGADSAIAINRLLKGGVQTEIVLLSNNERPRVSGAGASREVLQTLSGELGLVIQVAPDTNGKPAKSKNSAEKMLPLASVKLRAPRIGLYQSWTGNMDEGWTRWVLEQYEFPYVSLHNAAIKAGKLREKFDAIVLPDQQPRDILNGYDFKTVREEYRGGIGDEGVEALREFVRSGGTLIAMGASCDLMIDKFPIPVRNLKRGLTRDQHFAPGTILRIQVDKTNPLGLGMPAESYGFYNNSPFFALVEGFSSQKASVVARYPNSDIVASGWLKGEELMAGRAAVVSIEMNPGRIVLFGLRPQHRAQTHATFPILFNTLHFSAAGQTNH